jgi:TMEM175 potassium channel family protein
MQSRSHHDQERPPAPGVATRRLEAFSDAVFAIAITLLALTLQVPELTMITPQALVAALMAHWPSYLSFVLSFVTLLIAWVYHHRLLQGTKRAGTRLLYTNGALLLIVSAVPFPTALLGVYLTTAAASVVAAIYAGYIGLLNLSYNVLWWMVARPQRGRHIKGWRPPTSMLLSYLGFPGYLVAVAIAFWSPAASLVICGALWVLWTIMAPMPSAAQE